MLVLGTVLSALIGVMLGLVGGGGSILTVPLLVEVMHQPAELAVATSLLVVAITSVAALFTYARQGQVDWKIGAVFALSGAVGAYFGGLAAGLIPSTLLLGLFVVMMVATGLAMLLRAPASGESTAPGTFQPKRVVMDGLVVGAVTGLVGAGGGFLVVPALAMLGGLSMRRAVGTSLLVISVKSFAGFAGHAVHVDVDWGLAMMVVVPAVIGAVVAGKFSHRVPASVLRKGFAVFILLVALRMGVTIVRSMWS